MTMVAPWAAKERMDSRSGTGVRPAILVMMTLCGDVADKYRLSLGGVSSSGKEPLALQEFLRQHPEITTIELRLDNDAKGRMASVGIRKIYADRYTVHDLPPDIENGDYADMAKNNLMARTAAHRAAPCR